MQRSFDERNSTRVAARPRRRVPFATCGALLCLALAGCHGTSWNADRGKADHGIRAIWVTRWDYKRAKDIATIMENCKRSGFNTVLFQVRGNGTAFYRSKIEPWADELGGRNPGFDPLKVACKEAHRRGLALHAWVNVMPGWRGDQPPRNARQLYHAHADWFWRDSRGRRQPLGWYNSLNPCYPEVRGYLVSVMKEIVTRYRIDGLHLDYIRFPNEWNDSYPKGARVPDYPRDPRTLALFRKATGRLPESAPQLWAQWRTDQVTRLVRDIRHMMNREARGVKLSAAVGASLKLAKHKHFQDTRRWLAMGLLDAVYPMNYAAGMSAYEKNLRLWKDLRLRVPVVVGVMFDKRESGKVLEQTLRARQRHEHFSAFAYNSLFERLDKNGRPIRDKQSRARADLRRRVIPELRRMAGRRI